ncbi:MAG: hypothetical protein JOZ57_03985 [Abitibacteriaceae bacterium]|nr:hypothetical protein [Abditibacteriaceae bacterium]
MPYDGQGAYRNSISRCASGSTKRPRRDTKDVSGKVVSKDTWGVIGGEQPDGSFEFTIEGSGEVIHLPASTEMTDQGRHLPTHGYLQ